MSLINTSIDLLKSLIQPQNLAANEVSSLLGFGVFSVRSKRARPGRNPKSGEPIEISARKVVTFRDSPLALQENARCLI
ncbi:MAG: HU family DNA-binding protein [Magnetococcus sp. YQC-5]